MKNAYLCKDCPEWATFDFESEAYQRGVEHKNSTGHQVAVMEMSDSPIDREAEYVSWRASLATAPTLFEQPDEPVNDEFEMPPHQPQYDTSRAAAAVAGRTFKSRKEHIRVLIEAQPMTDDELWHAIGGEKISSLTSARWSLMMDGVIKDSGERRINRSGCKAAVWELGCDIPLTNVQRLRARVDELETRIAQVVFMLRQPEKIDLATLLDILGDETSEDLNREVPRERRNDGWTCGSN
jgi:hypothetical protein